MPEIGDESDVQLITRLTPCSDIGLAELYRRHAAAVFLAAWRVLHNTTEAEDVTQDVFLRLWKQPERFDPNRGTLRGFLLAQAHARAVDAIRSLNARRRREAGDAYRIVDADHDILHDFWTLVRADHLSRALGELPDDERRAIELAYFDGRSYVEVAQLLDQPEGTVKSRIRNGMRRMRVALVEAGIQGLGGVITHEESRDLLAAFALDAVKSDERGEIEAHLARCPRCRAELDGHRAVASGLGTTVEPVPDALWGSISSRLRHRGDHAAPTRSTLRPESPVHGPPRTGNLRRGRLASVTAIAVGMAAAATVLGAILITTNNRVAQLQGAIDEAAPTAVLAALETPGHRIVDLDTTSDHRLAEFVVLANGRGYLVKSVLPQLSANDTYQLWGVVNGQTISLGLLGRSPRLSTFTLAGSARPYLLGVTAERAGGSVNPSGPLLATGTV